MQKGKNYILGLDVGISSVGWGLLELDTNNQPFKILNTGVRIFTPGEVPKTGASKALERRAKRGARRIIQRREYRLDRVRLLLSEYSFIAGYPSNLIPSEREEYLTIVYDKMLQNYYQDKNTNPYEIKVKALSEKLSDEELAIILVHYAKHRGYKSNREDNEDTTGENGKIKKAIEENRSIMENKQYTTVSEMLLKDEKFKNRIRNSDDDYKMSVTREMYEQEIIRVLDAQIQFGLIDEEFKQKYLDIWKSQRHYSKGPGYYFYKENGVLIKKISPYGDEKSLIARMTGYCKFDHQPRAPKCAPSSELFILLEKLLNLRYKTTESYQKLTKEEIEKIIDVAKKKDKITYKDVVKVLKLENVTFKDNNLSRKDYGKCAEKIKELFGIDKDSQIDYNHLTEEEQKQYHEILDEKKLENTVGGLKTYNKFRKTFSKWNPVEWNKIKDNFKLLDEIAIILTDCKLNEDIKSEIEKSDLVDNSYYEIIISLPNLKDHIMLSLNILYQLIPIMVEGYRYDEAMKKIGLDHSQLHGAIEKSDLLPPITKADGINNQRVLRSLAQCRKVINAIIKKYGLPNEIKIETARELAKSRDERKKIEKDQKERYEKNIETKEQLVDLLPSVFKNIEYVSSTDLLKYRLWEEQGERCAYSLEKISIEELFDKNTVQIDHILPYSRTFDDSYFNKTLVLSKYNQEKREKTPYEWIGNTTQWNKFKNYILSLNISDKKKDNYLLKNLTQDLESEMRNQNLNDTKYISKFLVGFVKAHLNIDENKVKAFSGAITGKLRGRWGLNGLTHSLESSNYHIKNNNNYEKIKKNRDNHLHHAMDALVIASITPSLQNKIIEYEKFARFLNNKTSNQLQEFIDENNYDITQFTNENGEVTHESIKQYIDEGLKTGQLKTRKHSPLYYLSYPLPYEKFVEEAILRVYERDIDILCEKLKTDFKTYSEEELKSIHPIYPSFAKPKLSGALHKETISGYIQDRNILTNRVKLNDEKFTESKLNNIMDAENGAKEVYNTIKKWLAGYKNGKEAYATHKGYPINEKTGNIIKKVKIKSEYNNKGHFIKNGFVEKEDIYQIDIYTKEGEDNVLYFIGYDLFDLAQIKKDKDFDIILWYGQGNAKETMRYKELNQNYNFYLSLNRNQLIEVTKKDGTTGIGCVVGFSSGMFEIKSMLGDGKDLYGDNKLFNKERTRYHLTISTIESIEKLDISILGEIHGL